MMMARFVSQTLNCTSSTTPFISSVSAPGMMNLLTHRHRSNQSGGGKAQLIEVDLDSSSSSSNDDVDVLGRKLEDVIHTIIVKRSAPDWLPFIPGSSYWVPPRHSTPHGGLVKILCVGAGGAGKLTNPSLTVEESLPLSSVRGWPSYSYFIQQGGASSTHPVPVEVKVEVMVDKDSENANLSEDEEG